MVSHQRLPDRRCQSARRALQYAPERWDGDETSFTYDALGHMSGLRVPGTGAISYGYDANGQRTSLRYPDGARLSYAYWPAGRLAAYSTALSAQTLAGVAVSTAISSAIETVTGP